MTTRRGVSLLDQADPYLAVVRSSAVLLPEDSRQSVELARYQLYKALDRYKPEAAVAWLKALEAACEAACERGPLPASLREAVASLREVVVVHGQEGA